MTGSRLQVNSFQSLKRKMRREYRRLPIIGVCLYYRRLPIIGEYYRRREYRRLPSRVKITVLA